MPEVEYFEYCVQTTELNQRLVAQTFPISDGSVAIPDAPGLGVELDEEVVRACLVA
jgi:L-rhamnonate dehydratase